MLANPYKLHASAAKPLYKQGSHLTWVKNQNGAAR